MRHGNKHKFANRLRMSIHVSPWTNNAINPNGLFQQQSVLKCHVFNEKERRMCDRGSILLKVHQRVFTEKSKNKWCRSLRLNAYKYKRSLWHIHAQNNYIYACFCNNASLVLSETVLICDKWKFVYYFCCLSSTGPLLVLLASSESAESLTSDNSGWDFSCNRSLTISAFWVCFSLIAGREVLCNVQNKHSITLCIHVWGR